MPRSACILTLALLVATPGRAATILVPGDQPTIQAGIDAAAAGDTVLVAPGVYLEHDVVMKSGLVLRSESGDPTTTVIDAEEAGRVLSCHYLDDTTVIEGLTFTGGRAGWGAGIDVEFGSPRITRCVFLLNAAGVDGGGGWGGGLYSYEADPTLEECVFQENTSTGGGGAYCDYEPSPTFINCLFLENSAGVGGGVYCADFTAPTLSGCTLYGNFITSQEPEYGGGIACAYGSSPLLENTIIAFGPQGWAVGTTCPWNPSNPILNCCDLYGNTDGDWVGCTVELQANINGNFSADPLFCDADNGDFTIQSDSPCAPPGATNCGLVGALPVGCGPVSVVEESWARIKSKYR